MKQNNLFKTLQLLLLFFVGGASLSWADTAIPLTVGTYLDTSTSTTTGTINNNDGGNLGGISKDATATFTLTNTSAQDMVLCFLTGNNNNSNPQVTVTMNDGSSDFFTKTVDIENTGSWTPITMHAFDLGTVPAGTITLTFTFTNTSSYVCNLGSIGIYNKDAYIATLDQMPGDITLSKGIYNYNSSSARYNYNNNGKVGWLNNGATVFYPSLYASSAGTATLNIGMTYNGDGTMNVKVTDASTGVVEVNEDLTITSDKCQGLTTPTAFELGDITAGFKTMKLTMSTSANYLIDYQDLSISLESFKDIAIDLRSGQLGTSGNNMQKYVTVGDSYTYSDEAPESYNAILSASSYNGSDHGYVGFKAKVPVKTGIYKITLGTCQYGTGTGYVKSEDESSTLNVVDGNGQTVTSFNQNNGTCYHQNTTDNVVSVWYTATSDETITIVGGNYTPYFSIEKVNAVPEQKYTVTYVNNDGSATGTVPAVVAVSEGSSVTIPANRTLYKEGYTLTGWNDGTTIYAVGSSFIPIDNTTLTAVFAANSYNINQSLTELTVRWDFQRRNGAPTVEWQNRTGDFLVTQANVNGSSIDVKLDINTNPGKFNNASWTDYCQINEGTTFTFPSKNGTTVTAYSMNEPKNASDVKSDLDGNEYSSFSSNVASYSTTSTSGSSVLTIKGGTYYRYIDVSYPVTVIGAEISDATIAGQVTTAGDDTDWACNLPYSYSADNTTIVLTVANGTVTATAIDDASANVTVTKDGNNFTIPTPAVGHYTDVTFTLAATEGAISPKTTYIYRLSHIAYTNTWQFGRGNGVENIALERSAEWTYTVNGHSLVVNTASGKLNNTSRNDQWAQCNGGTLFKVPVYAEAKLSWGKYYSGSETGFTINDQLYNDYYIATEDGTVNMTATGIGYLSYIKVEPVIMYNMTGIMSSNSADGASIVFTANGNGQSYSTTITSGAFAIRLPADTYTLELLSASYVITSPASITVNEAGNLGTITITAATEQTVTGSIANAPDEAFTLTFTGTYHTETVSCEANATSYTKALMPDTYTMSSSVGTLSPLSVEKFKVVNAAASHNIYYPESVPAATQQNIRVDNTLAAASANNYKTITDALAAAKAGSISSPVITLTSGQTYREQVIVNQANVTFKTSDTEKATITWYYGIGYSYYSLNANGYYDKDRANTRNSKLGVGPARWGCTVLVNQYGNGFKAENIIFENSFNQYYTTEEVADGVEANQIGSSITYNRTLTPSDEGYKAADARTPTERAAAIAFENNPTGCQLYNCEFLSSQDTFFSSGKIYVKNCSIMGNTDYIFGGGNVVFDDCDLVIGGYSDQKASAYITANSASTGERYIFRDCTVKPSSRTYVSANLGRDWGGTNAHVYFFNLKNELGSDMSFTWNNMGGAVSAGTADLHIYDFNPTINTTYSTTGSSGANVNGVVSDADATTLYTGVVTDLGFTPEHIYDIPIDENSYYNNIRIKASDNGTGDITLTRTIKADKWNTIVLPFALTSDQIDAAFGDDAKVAQLTSFGDNTLHFTTVTEMNANEPYMIKVGTAFSNATINDVTIVESTPSKTDVNGIDFVGTYDAIINIPFSDASNTYYFISGNTLYSTASSGTANTMKGTRAYFQVPVSGGAKSLSYDFDNNGETTSIEQIVTPQFDNSEPMYNLAGQRVGTNYKGVIIQNGKKIVVK